MNKNSNIDDLIGCIADFSPIKNIETLCDRLDLNRVGRCGRTPQMVAAAEGCLDAVVVLLSKGASVKALGAKKSQLFIKHLQMVRLRLLAI